MKKAIIASIFFFFAIVGCGGGGGSGGSSNPTTSNAPVISSLVLSPSEIDVGDGGGAMTIAVQFDFIDIDGGLVGGTIMVDGPSGEQSITIFSITGGSNPTSGSVIFQSVGNDTTVARTFTVDFWIIDTQNNASNKLTGTIVIS